MALGTLTLTASDLKGEAGLFIDRVTLVGDTSYPTGGSTGLQTALQALTKDGRTIIKVDSVDQGYVAHWDVANLKLKFMYGDNNNAADGPLIEVPNTTALNGITYNMQIFSK
jgi:hypothetical protein